ncbi:hypothetical protein F511_20055 [Dorcoceras hygrometricum]|uniref:Uncharacterized protein n=1 Tax=Dorcoceras hygrometricum TaxID=472368 RepID=A0A2Z7CVF8_9LAMI|nr:hypothetical protein F511_20055 [Dorcoceras hygrometricum]
MADVETYMATVNRAYRSERGRKDMRDDFQRKRQMQHPIRGQSSQPPTKRPYQGPPKGPNPQGQQQQRTQGQQRPQQQGSSAPRSGGFPVCREYRALLGNLLPLLLRNISENSKTPRTCLRTLTDRPSELRTVLGI